MITLRCAAVPSLHLRKGSICITGSAIQSACQPPLILARRSNRRFIRFVDLASATADEIDQLSAACNPTTFGRGNEDVRDKSYRRAVKMDASNFAVQFDPVRTGLIKIIEEELLRSQKSEVFISAEIYKLNVYGGFSDIVVFEPWPALRLTVNFALSRQGLVFQSPQGYFQRDEHVSIARDRLSDPTPRRETPPSTQGS